MLHGILCQDTQILPGELYPLQRDSQEADSEMRKWREGADS